MKLYLLTEASFHPSYLVDKWFKTFGQSPHYGGILVRDQPTPLTQSHDSRLPTYPALSTTEQAMIDMFGIPDAARIHPPCLRLPSNLNSRESTRMVTDFCTARDASNPPFLFVFLDQILSAWWLTFTRGNIINAHSAVLPYARGMYALEQVMAQGNRLAVENIAGSTIHYVDHGVDSGPIISARRITNPWVHTSIWQLKARVYMHAFDSLIDCAEGFFDSKKGIPVGTAVTQQMLGPNFRAKDFTEEVKRAAENNYDLLSAKSRNEH